jgi:uncharacterized protein
MAKQIIVTFLILSLLATAFSGCTVQEEQKKDSTQPTEEISLNIKAQYFVENLSYGNYDSVFYHFTAEMKSVLPLTDLQYAWETLIMSYGDFEEIITTRKTVEQGYDVVLVTCSFSILGVLDLRFVFDEQNQVAGLQFVPTQSTAEYTIPDYVNLSKFVEEDITIGSHPWVLPATVSIPTGEKPFPAVVLVHGSGPNDRNETIGPNQPFKDIAQGLASRGILVLRYDKRSMVYPEECKSLTNFTLEDEVIDDALSAITYLQNNKNVNYSQIYLLGHSLGAMMAPEIARQKTVVNGMVLLAAPARSFEDLYLAQYTYLAELDGTIDENEQKMLKDIEASVQKIKDLNISTDESVFNLPFSYWEYLSTYDAIETSNNLSIPILILQGKRDYQVTYEDDFIIWQETFHNSTMVTLKDYNTLNHLFISGTGTPTNTEYLDPGNMDEQVIIDIASWIKEQKFN